MSAMSPDTEIASLGECHYPSPLRLAALNHAYIHVPIPLATAKRRQLNLQSELWHSVLAVTGQPAGFE